MDNEVSNHDQYSRSFPFALFVNAPQLASMRIVADRPYLDASGGPDPLLHSSTKKRVWPPTGVTVISTVELSILAALLKSDLVSWSYIVIFRRYGD